MIMHALINVLAPASNIPHIVIENILYFLIFLSITPFSDHVTGPYLLYQLSYTFAGTDSLKLHLLLPDAFLAQLLGNCKCVGSIPVAGHTIIVSKFFSAVSSLNFDICMC